MALSTDDLKSKQLESCPSQSKVSLVIVNTVDDPASKATFYVIQAIVVDSSGNQQQQEPRYRYSQLLEFNDTLIHDYGAIRILRLFPPKKFVGNKEGSFVQQRKDAIQEWLNEIIADEELVDDAKIRKFFNVALPE
jgi:hypothetical protein